MFAAEGYQLDPRYGGPMRTLTKTVIAAGIFGAALGSAFALSTLNLQPISALDGDIATSPESQAASGALADPDICDAELQDSPTELALASDLVVTAAITAVRAAATPGDVLLEISDIRPSASAYRGSKPPAVPDVALVAATAPDGSDAEAVWSALASGSRAVFYLDRVANEDFFAPVSPQAIVVAFDNDPPELAWPIAGGLQIGALSDAEPGGKAISMGPVCG